MPNLTWEQDGTNYWKSDKGEYVIVRNHQLCPKPYWALCNGIGVGGGDTFEAAAAEAEGDYAVCLEIDAMREARRAA